MPASKSEEELQSFSPQRFPILTDVSCFLRWASWGYSEPDPEFTGRPFTGGTFFSVHSSHCACATSQPQADLFSY